MRFTFEDKNYAIEFAREFKVPAGSIARIPRPYTTAKVLEVVEEVKGKPTTTRVVREYTVGYNHNDRFSYETGRKIALAYALYDAPTKGGGESVMGPGLTKAFREAVWHAYHGRPGGILFGKV